MGLRARLLSFARVIRNSANISDVKVDTGGGVNVTAEHFASAGDDSFPLTTDYAYVSPVPTSGGFVVVGYIDPKSEPKAQAGDKRIYARKSDGALAVEVWLKNDGSVVIANDNGSFEMEAGGDVIINGAKITTDGDVITASGVSLDNHPHAQGVDSANDTQVPTNAPTATE